MKNTDSSAPFSRRRLFRGLFAAGGGVALGSMVTGLPRAVLLGHAVAQEDAEPTFLLLSSGEAGHPINANIAGTYPEEPDDAMDPLRQIDHARTSQLGRQSLGSIDGVGYGAADFERPADVRFGGSTYKAAGVWGALPEAMRRRMSIVHHATMANAHPEFRNVTEFHGAIRGIEGVRRETLASMIAQENAAALGTLTREPVNLGSNFLSFKGRPLPRFRPNQLRDLFRAGGGPDADVVGLRDALLDDLYRDVRESGSHAQRQFLDRYALSQSQALELGDSLGPLLSDARGRTPLDEGNRSRGHAAMGSSDGGVAVVFFAARASMRKAMTSRSCFRSVSTAESIRSMNRLPRSLWVPKDSFRRMTA